MNTLDACEAWGVKSVVFDMTIIHACAFGRKTEAAEWIDGLMRFLYRHNGKPEGTRRQRLAHAKRLGYRITRVVVREFQPTG